MIYAAIIICIVGAAIIFTLREAASLCNAKMDIVAKNFSQSIYKDKNPYWFDPSRSWANKDDYAANTPIWRQFAKENLPKFLFFIVDKVKPAYDPFSDFWHYQKFCFLMLDFASAIVWGLTIKLTAIFHKSFLAFAIYMAILASAWAFGWLLSFDKNRKKLMS